METKLYFLEITPYVRRVQTYLNDNGISYTEHYLPAKPLNIKVETEMVVFTRILMAIESLAATQDEIIDHQKMQAKALNEMARLKREKGI